MRSALKKALKELPNQLTTMQLSTLGRTSNVNNFRHNQTKKVCKYKNPDLFGKTRIPVDWEFP